MKFSNLLKLEISSFRRVEISRFRRVEISKQTNAKGDDSNLNTQKEKKNISFKWFVIIKFLRFQKISFKLKV